MEKLPPSSAKPKKKLMKILTRAVSSITFQSHPSSPGRNKKTVAKEDKHKSNPKSEVSGQNGSIVRTPEPTSPRISCMGHIRQRKKWPKNMNLLLRKEMKQGSNGSGNKTKPVLFLPETTTDKISSRMQNIGNKSEASTNDKSTALIDRSASLSQMKRFGSSRGSLSKFDWKTEQRDHRGDYEEEEEEISFSFFPAIHHQVVVDKSGPIALEPRKETNLWIRRTNITQLKPLKVNNCVFRL